MDDDSAARQTLVELLENHCLDARSVGSVDLALALLREWPVDLLIADAHLPEMTGEELVARCQALRCRPRIILLTENAPPGLPPDGGQVDVHGVVQKPLSLEALVDLLAGTDDPCQGEGT